MATTYTYNNVKSYDFVKRKKVDRPLGDKVSELKEALDKSSLVKSDSSDVINSPEIHLRAVYPRLPYVELTLQ